MKLSIIIPAYNEEKRIGRTLDAYSSFFDKIYEKNKLDYEILVVINGTIDKTEEVVKSFQKKNKKISYLNFKMGGKGFAIIEGFKDSLKRKNNLIGYVDADMATPPKSFYDLVLEINNFDGSIASRYVAGSEVYPKISFRRTLVSRVFNLLVRTLFYIRYKDTQCGAKLFTRNAIERVLPLLGMTGWAFDIELLYLLKKNNLKAKEVKTIWREIEGTHINILKSTIQMIFAVIQLRIVNSKLQGLLKPVRGIIGFLWRLIK
jgi:glycosyltransferase involved in cell wall biosynthesis